MKAEWLFRLFSIAGLALLAIALSTSGEVEEPQSVLSQPKLAQLDSIDLELEKEAIEEVEAINAGGFQPYLAGHETN